MIDQNKIIEGLVYISFWFSNDILAISLEIRHLTAQTQYYAFYPYNISFNKRNHLPELNSKTFTIEKSCKRI